MSLIKGSLLPSRFAKLARQSERIDIAVAWATPCEAIETLAESGAYVRVAVGVSNNFTTPTTLRRFTEFAELRVVSDDSLGIFHPKYYCFHGKKTICWVGSANLTGGGFGRNVELVYEFELKREQDREWFERLWEDLKPDPWPAIREYEARYVPPRRTPRPPGTRRPPGTQSEPKLPDLADIVEWQDFVEGLRAYDEYYRYYEYGYDVFGETHSWLHTIKTGREVVRLDDWSMLTERECFILRGHPTRARGDEGNWGLLGGVDRGGAAYVFNHRRSMREIGRTRTKIREQINRVLYATNNVADVAHETVQAIKEMCHVKDARSGIGHAAATRWLALPCPHISCWTMPAIGSGQCPCTATLSASRLSRHACHQAPV